MLEFPHSLQQLAIINSQPMTDQVTSLNKYLFLNFLRDWLELSDICRLDTSLCNLVVRSKYTEFFTNAPHLTLLKSKKLLVSNRVVEWLFQKCIAVTDIEFSNNFLVDLKPSQITNGLIRSIKSATKIQITCSSSKHNHVLFHLLRHISTNLTEIDVPKSTLNLDVVVTAHCIASCPNLTRCNCGYAQHLSSLSIVLLCEHCPLLTYLNIWNGLEVDDLVLATIASHCPLMMSFFARSQQMTAQGLNDLAAGCFRLKVFHLGCEATISHKPFSALFSSNPKLTQFHLDSFYSENDTVVNSAFLNALGQHCPNLTKLHLPSKNGIYFDCDILALCSGCLQIVRLDLGELDPRLTLESCRIIVQKLRHLRCIEFQKYEHETFSFPFVFLNCFQFLRLL